MNKFIFHLRKAILGRDFANVSDGQLLERFIANRDEAAFEALVHRLGPMVLRVCQYVVGDEHDAEDAFQATFLVLARKAETIVPHDHVGCWLRGVAFRTSQAARTARLRRRMRERQVVNLPHPAVRPPGDPDILPLLDRELNRLPEKLRLPIILCGLEGRPRKEVAAQLRLPEGTLASRLDTARRLLAERLARYGIAISAVAALLAVPKEGLAHPPLSLIAATVQAAMTSAPAAVLALANSVLRAATWLDIKVVTAVLLFALVGAGSGLAAWQAGLTKSEIRPMGPIGPIGLISDSDTKIAHHEPTDFDRLQGVWNVVLVEHDGAIVPQTEKVGKHLVFVQDDKVMTHVLRVQDGPNYVTATVRLNTTANPKTIEVLHGGGRLWEGIYLLEEDTMKVCIVPVGHKPPTAFTTTANSLPTLVILKRDSSIAWDIAKWQKAVQEQS